MRIAILGATSQIAKDLVLSMYTHGIHELVLYSRQPDALIQWQTRTELGVAYAVAEYSSFATNEQFDAIVNFVGVGDPAQVSVMGSSIFDVTLKYDEMALHYLQRHPTCRYIFLSSGAAYGSKFDVPANANTTATVAINNLQPQDWYAVAKMHAECRHRSLPHLAIVDLRVFNYFSATLSNSTRFLISDILRAVESHQTLITSTDDITRDYIGPEDFYQLIALILAAPTINCVVDCYTKSPVSKMELLANIQDKYGLTYQTRIDSSALNATGLKRNYFSQNYAAEWFGYSPEKTSLETVLHGFECRLGAYCASDHRTGLRHSNINV